MYNYSTSVHNTRAAQLILPILFKINKPKSILDVGTGIGTWLSTAKELGVDEVLGIDGEYVDSSLRVKFLSDSEFLPYDLNRSLNLNRKFDLIICLEVAEHLPELSADTLIETLNVHSDLVLFSAAIPGQGGQNHLNEQWPSYWISKFENLGFKVYDPIRPDIWEDQRIDPWYRQNIFLFSRKPLSLPEPILCDVVLPYFFTRQVERSRFLEKQIADLLNGKKGFLFYFKRVFFSIFKFGGRKTS